MKKNIAYIDKVYYNGCDKKVYGDLSYHFCDMDDTRVPAEDAEDLRYSLSSYIDSPDAVEAGDAGYDFSIYYIVFDCVEQNEWQDGVDGRLAGEKKVGDVYVFATEERAKKVVEEYFSGATLLDASEAVFHYRGVEDEDEE